MAKSKVGPSTRAQARKFIQRMERRVAGGLRNAASTHNAIFSERVQEFQTTPVGSHRRKGQIYRGEVVQRSDKGEYPWREFGTGADSIRFSVDRKNLTAKSGVTQEGIHLYYLEFGHHWVSGEAFDRKGLVAAYHDYKPTIAQAFIDGFRTAP